MVCWCDSSSVKCHARALSRSRSVSGVCLSHKSGATDKKGREQRIMFSRHGWERRGEQQHEKEGVMDCDSLTRRAKITMPIALDALMESQRVQTILRLLLKTETTERGGRLMKQE